MALMLVSLWLMKKEWLGRLYLSEKIRVEYCFLTDVTHSIPVQVLRNDVRVIASGTGHSDELTLDNVPRSVDIEKGDLLVTSGLGGRFCWRLSCGCCAKCLSWWLKLLCNGESETFGWVRSFYVICFYFGRAILICRKSNPCHQKKCVALYSTFRKSS